MASRKRDKAAIRERKKARDQQRQQQLMVQAGVLIIGIVALGLIAYFAFGLGKAAPEVAQERLDLDPILGNPDATVTITEYAAFGCEACRAWHEAGIIDDILAQFPNQVKFVFRDMPIILAPWSQAMSEIAQCALDQGNDAFWLAHDTLFEDTDQGNTPQAAAIDLVIADNPDLDGDALRACVDANTHIKTILYDMERDEARLIPGTPTWFVNGQQLYSASPQTLIEMIQAELNS